MATSDEPIAFYTLNHYNKKCIFIHFISMFDRMPIIADHQLHENGY